MIRSVLLISFLCCVNFIINAQLCKGSEGDPIINITFGSHGGRLAYGETDFDFTNGCPSKGTYTLTPLIFGCGDNHSWLTVSGDHTGDQDGNYMIVNAESWDGVTTPAIIHRDTAAGLCSNVNYVFSTWVTGTTRRFSCNNNTVPANIEFKVTTLSGVEIASTNSVDIPQTEESFWREYGLTFQLPPGVSTVVLTVMTIRKFGCGQGFAIDDITLRPCGPKLDATVNGIKGPLDVCADFSGGFNFKGTYDLGFTNATVQWQRSIDTGKTWSDIPNANSVNYFFSPKDTGVILFRMAAADGDNIHSLHCRILSNVLYTNVHSVPPHNPPQNVIGCLNKNLLLPKRDPFAFESSWTGPNGYYTTNEYATVLDFSFADTGLYQLNQHFQTGCSTLDTFYIKAFPSTTISVNEYNSICEGQNILLNAEGDGSFLWKPGTGLSDSLIANPYASPHDSTVYTVTVTNKYGCKDSALVLVYVYKNPYANAGMNKTIVKGDSVMLNGTISGTSIHYFWTPSNYMDNNKTTSPMVSPPMDMQYTLIAQSDVGCGTKSSNVLIKVYNDVYIPNSFTPNNDGKNDLFRIIAADGYKLIRFQVYNRWGQLIFNATDLSKGWDGTFKNLPQPQDTYIYELQIESAYGRIVNKKGTITLIR